MDLTPPASGGRPPAWYGCCSAPNSMLPLMLVLPLALRLALALGEWEREGEHDGEGESAGVGAARVPVSAGEPTKGDAVAEARCMRGNDAMERVQSEKKVSKGFSCPCQSRGATLRACAVKREGGPPQLETLGTRVCVLPVCSS
jgi:hypothetical protein